MIPKVFSFGFIGGSNGWLESNRYTAMVRNWVGNTGGSNKVGTISRIQIEDTSGVIIKHCGKLPVSLMGINRGRTHIQIKWAILCLSGTHGHRT